MRPPRYHRLTGRSRPATCAVRMRAPAAVAAPSRRVVHVVADLSAKGRPILPKSITVQRIMGEGSFGQVFEGSLNSPAGNQRVVLKRVKTRVQGAEAMSQMEHLLNVYASRVARGHCADFLGYCEVADSESTVRLTQGLWLVWKYEGSKTLSYYLRRRDTLRALAMDMEVPEAAVVATVMKQILEGLAAFHAAGLVHRDVKPLNVIFAEDVRRFKLIDLGACADLRTGTNYVPEESILDLNFCPPEQYVMPTDSPHISKQAGLIKLAISPMLWAKHRPDRFDTWSAGVVMLQLAVPAMRTDRALRAFNTTYGPKFKYDLAAWRKATYLPARDCAPLDADDGAGWDLLQSLLAPRHIQVDDNGGVSFVNDTPFSRISAYEALKHRFIKNGLEGAVAPASAAAVAASSSAASMSRGSMSGSEAGAVAPGRKAKAGSGAAAVAEPVVAAQAKGTGGGMNSDPLSSALGVWRDVTGRLFDLEARIMRQASATEMQTTTVRRLKEQVDSGRTDPALLQKEEKVLNKMQSRLAGLQQDFTSTANQASGLFSFFGLGSKQQQQQQRQPAVEPSKAKSNLQALRVAESASAAAASSSTTSSTSAPPAPSAAGMFNSVWERLSSQLSDLERKISNQASATERQSLVVRGLRAKVKAGEAEAEMLDKAERTLGRMERRLLDLDQDYRAAKQSAKGALAGAVPAAGDAGRGGKQRSGSKEQSVPGVAEAVQAADAALLKETDNEKNGSFWSRLLGAPGRSLGSSGGSMDGSTKEASLREAQASTAPPPPPKQQPEGPGLPWGVFGRAISPSSLMRRQQQQAQQQQAQNNKNARQQQPPPPAVQQPQQQPQQGSGGYRSIFGTFGGGGAAPTAPEPQPAAPAASASSSSTLNRATSPRSGGGSGFFSGLFGRPRQQQQQDGAPTAQPASNAASAGPQAPPSQQQSGAGSRAASQGQQVSEVLPSGLVTPPPAVPAAASGGEALVEGASRVVRNSLGFTGLAAKIAGDLASALKADAERYLKEIEVQEAAKRQQRTLDLAFLALLREAQPPVLSSTPYEAAGERFAGEARWAALAEEPRRRELYGKYVQAAKKVEEQAAAAADAGFRAALRGYKVTATSKWDEFQANLPASDPALIAVQDSARRQQLFLEVVAELQLQAALQAASQKAELEFSALLAELRDPPLTSTSTWSLVRRSVASDSRCQALPERRRRELFEAYTARLFEEESAKAEVLAAAAAAADEQLVQAAAFPVTISTSASATPIVAPALTQSLPAVSAVAAAIPTHIAPTPEAAPTPAPAPAAPVPVPVAASTATPAETSQPPASLPSSVPASLAPDLSAPSVAEDDDLSAALAGMEAALETAIKAVSLGPVSHPIMVSGPGGGGNNVVSGPAARLQSSAPANGVAKKPAAGASPGADVPGGGGGGGGAAPYEGIRLDELRREQARLRAEYEAMAQRLREMEERLKGQAQLMSAVDEAGEDAGATGASANDDGDALDGTGSSNGSSNGSPASYNNGNSVSNHGTYAPQARGQRWR